MSKQPANKPPNPPAQREVHTSITQRIEESSFSGPIPPPAVLEEYDRVVPGAAERILKMAEADVQFQRDITFAALNAEMSEGKRGQLFGFLIGIFALTIAAVALYLGHPDTASVIGGTTVVGLVSAFVLGRIFDRPQEQDRPKIEKK